MDIGAIRARYGRFGASAGRRTWRAARSTSAPYSNGYALRLVVGAMARSRLVLACNGKFIYSKFAHRDPVPIEPLRFMRGALLETRPPWWPAQTTTQAGEGPERRQQVEPVWSCKASAFYALDLLCVPLCSRLPHQTQRTQGTPSCRGTVPPLLIRQALPPQSACSFGCRPAHSLRQ